MAECPDTTIQQKPLNEDDLEYGEEDEGECEEDDDDDDDEDDDDEEEDNSHPQLIIIN